MYRLLLLLPLLTACATTEVKEVPVPYKVSVVCTVPKLDQYVPTTVAFTPVLGADMSGKRDIGPNTVIDTPLQMWVALDPEQYEALSMNTAGALRAIQQLSTAFRTVVQCIDNHNKQPVTGSSVQPTKGCRTRPSQFWKPKC